MDKLFAGIELGGTKIVAAVGYFGKIVEKVTFQTSSPEKNIKELIGFFKNKKVQSIGIGSFGPIVIDPKDSNFGLITNTTKTGWSNFNIIKALKDLNLPLFLQTDVGVAALGELFFGNGKNLNDIVYWTIGTGIGAGIIIKKELFHGIVNTEIGHWLISREKGDLFAGVCSIHQDCLEGLASGPSLIKRYGVKQATDLPTNHKAWDLEAKYLSIAMINTILAFSPERIILGGGVMKNKELYPKIRKLTLEFCNKFFRDKKFDNIDDYIAPPLLGDDAGVIGALAFAIKQSK